MTATRLHRLRHKLTEQIDPQIRDTPPQPAISLAITTSDAELLLTVIDKALPIEPTERGPANKPTHKTGVRVPATDRKRRQEQEAA